MEENKKENSFEEDKQQLNPPSTDEPIAAAETSDLPTGQAGIINQTLDIEDMEVHHQSIKRE